MQRAGRDRREQQRRRRACAYRNKKNLHHRKLSRFESG